MAKIEKAGKVGEAIVNTEPIDTPDTPKKKEEKSVMYHKDGVIFIDMFKAPDAQHMKSFTKLMIPKGLKMTCMNCSTEITSFSKKYEAYYCAQCLRIYLGRTYDMNDPEEKQALKEWTNAIRVIVPSNKKNVKAPISAIDNKVNEQIKLDIEVVDSELGNIF